MCILDELYREWHSPRERPWEEEHEAWEYSEDLWTEAEKYLDAELFDRLKQSVMDLMDMEACREFGEGVRLGAQLMLELSGSAVEPRQALSSTASAPARCPIPTL